MKRRQSGIQEEIRTRQTTVVQPYDDDDDDNRLLRCFRSAFVRVCISRRRGRRSSLSLEWTAHAHTRTHEHTHTQTRTHTRTHTHEHIREEGDWIENVLLLPVRKQAMVARIQWSSYERIIYTIQFRTQAHNNYQHLHAHVRRPPPPRRIKHRAGCTVRCCCNRTSRRVFLNDRSRRRRRRAASRFNMDSFMAILWLNYGRRRAIMLNEPLCIAVGHLRRRPR